MSGRKRYERAISSLAKRKENKPQIFSGILGVTTNGENQIEVPSRNGFVWVRLRNQLNELVQAFNDGVSTVFDLPVLVEWDKLSPTRYKIIGRDTGRYLDWGSSSTYEPVHGAQHSFNPAIGQTGGDIVWVYSQQFMPLLITPSGSSGAMSVSAQPAPYYYDEQFRWAGGTGIAGFDGMRPTGSSNARMLLVYLDPDSGNILIATGSMTEFANTITGTAQILPYMPSLLEPTDVPLAGVRLITGTASLLWPNVYDLRDFLVHSSVSGSNGGGDTTLMTLLTIEGALAVESNPLRIYNRYGETKTVSEVFLSVDTPPTDASIIVDVHKDGTTIFTTQSNRPAIAAGANTGNTTTIEVPAWAVGEYLTMDVDQIGSGTAGSNLTVHIVHS